MKIEKIADYGERVFLVLLIIPFLLALAQAGITRPYVALLAVSESLAVALIIFRRPGQMVVKPYPLAIALLGTGAPLLVRPDSGGTALISAAFATFIMSTGLVVNIWAKGTLWRSFGITAANRGVKVGRPYRLVRHPMYLGYFITQLGFLLSSLSALRVRTH